MQASHRIDAKMNSSPLHLQHIGEEASFIAGAGDELPVASWAFLPVTASVMIAKQADAAVMTLHRTVVWPSEAGLIAEWDLGQVDAAAGAAEWFKE